jgi:hypothetical protein
MGLFGGGNSSSSTTNLTQTENTDQRVVADANSTVLNSGGGAISFTDEGATARALDAARDNATLASKSLADLIGLSRNVASEQRQGFGLLLDTADRAFARIDAQQSSSLNKFATLAGDISSAGAQSAASQAKSLAESFGIASGKSPNAVLILGVIAVAAFYVWKVAK